MSHGAEVEVPHDENDPFVKKVALCVAIFAVILAVATMAGKNAGKDMLAAQLDAQNQFSQYQAKSQREVLYMQEREALEEAHGELTAEQQATLTKAYQAAQKDRTKVAADPLERRKQRLAYVVTKLAEYKSEKEALLAEGKRFEAVRHTSHRVEGYFDYAELFLQIGIVLASIAMLSKTKWTFSLSLILALIAIALGAGGYLIPTKYPQVHIPIVDPAPEEGEAKH